MEYMLRISSINGYPSPRWLARQVGISSMFMPTEKDRRALASALGKAPDDVRKLVPSGDLQSRVFLRHGKSIFHRSGEERRYRPVCPECLVENGHGKFVWSLKPVTACPVHEKYLVDTCDECGDRLNWNRGELLTCDCRRDLRKIAGRPADDVVWKFSADISAAFETGFVSGEPLMLPNCFHGVRFEYLFDQLLLLACYASGKGRGTGRHHLSRISIEANKEAFDRVAHVLQDWPNSLFFLLDDIRKFNVRSERRTGLEAEFKGFYQALYPASKPDPRYLQLRTAFEAYIRQCWSGGYTCGRNSRLAHIATEDARAVPLAQAARLLGVHRSILRRELDANRLNALSKRMGRRTLTMIERSELERYRSECTERLTLADASAVIGISRKCVLDLVEAGVLPAASGPRIDGETFWCFFRRDVRELLTSLRQCKKGCSAKAHELTFSAALRRLTSVGLCASDLVRAVQAGDLKVLRVDRNLLGVSALVFDAEALEEFKRAARPTIEWAIPIRTVARRLKLNEQAARDLVATGLLPTVSTFSAGRERRLVSMEAINAFSKVYICASDIALEKNTSPKAVVVQLAAQGIYPRTGPSVDGTRQYFYARCSRVDDFMSNPAG